MNNILEELNAEQLLAVKSEEQYNLVIAGAGSGKTKLLTARLWYLLKELFISPNHILVLTFSRKAAKELKERIEQLLGNNYLAKRIKIGTFHNVCLNILHQIYRKSNLENQLKVIDEQEQLKIIELILLKLNYDVKQFKPSMVRSFISYCKGQGLRANDKRLLDFDKDLVKIYAEYSKYCQHIGFLDFDEIIFKNFEILRDYPSILEKFSNQYHHILIDEFQDTSLFQYIWLLQLAGDFNHIFACGDDDQSIYAFRGAYVQNLNHFAKYYTKNKIYRLEQNYRSNQDILDLANNLIKNNVDRFDKNLWSQKKQKSQIQLNISKTKITEAHWICKKIKQLQKQGEPLNQIAVLYRNKSLAEELEKDLILQQIAYQKTGGIRYFDRAEIKDLIAYFQLVADPNNDVAFLRVLNVPTRGIGKKVSDLFIENNNLEISYYQYAKQLSTENSKIKEKLEPFLNLINDLRNSNTSNLFELFDIILEKTKLLEYYTKIDTQNATKELRKNNKSNNILNFKNSIISFMQNLEEQKQAFDFKKNLAQFLNLINLQNKEEEEKTENIDESPNAVFLSTIHAVKGLEFNNVFIIGLENNIFPNARCFPPTQADEIIKNNAFNLLQEERRLMYVAITRAKSNLFFCFTQKNRLYAPKNKYKPQKQNFNHYVDNEKSIFLKELNFD